MNNAYIFKVFDSPKLVAGQVDFGIARAGSKYILVFAKGNGMLVTRRFSELNVDPPAPGSDGHQLIWFDAAIDRDPRNLGPVGGTLAALLAASPTVIRLTGRVRGETQEVEVLLDEDELARVCSSCGLIESKTEERRWQRHTGEGFESQYWCDMCARSSVRRATQYLSAMLTGGSR